MKKIVCIVLMLLTLATTETSAEVEIVNATPFRILFKYYVRGSMHVWGKWTDSFFIGEVIEPAGTVIEPGKEYLAFDTVNKQWTGYDGRQAPPGIKPILHPEEGVPLRRVVGSIRHNADGCLIKTRYVIYFDKYVDNKLTGDFEVVDQNVDATGQNICYRWIKITPKIVQRGGKYITTVDFTV